MCVRFKIMMSFIWIIFIICQDFYKCEYFLLNLKAISYKKILIFAVDHKKDRIWAPFSNVE